MSHSAHPADAANLAEAPSGGTGGGRLVRLAKTFIRAHFIALGVIAGLILVYALAGFFLVPRLARTAAQDYVRDTLHRQLAIGEVTFNPFTFESRVHDLSLREADGSPIVGFKTLLVNAELSSVWHRAIVLKELQLEGADVDFVVERDGSVNLSKLAPETAEEEPAEERVLPSVRIGALTISNARVDVEDRSRPQTFEAALAPIHFKLTDFRTDLNYRNAYAFSATSQAGEQLEWSGDFTVQPLGSTGKFSIVGLRAQTVDEYLGADLPFRIASGVARLRGDYRMALDPLALDVELPNVELQDLALTERAGAVEPPVVLPQVSVNRVNFSYAQHSLTVDEVLIERARFDVVRESEEIINLMRLGGESTAAEPAASQPSAAAPATSESVAKSDWMMKVGAVRFTNGTVLVEDRTVEPVAKLALAPVSVTVSNVSSDPAAKIGVDASITINEGNAPPPAPSPGGDPATLNVKGEVQAEPLNAQLTIDLEDFQLPVLQPYIAQVAALTLHSGRLDADGKLSFASAEGGEAKLGFTGNVTSRDVRTTDRLENEDFVKWGRLDVAGIDFEQNPDRLSIQRITARSPYARVIIAKDQTLNVSRVLNADQTETDEPATKAEGTKPKQSAPPADASRSGPIRIKSVQVVDGSAHFADFSIEPSFATGILGLEGAVTGLSSDAGSRATVQLKGNVDQYAPVDINGTLNLLAAAMFTDIAMNFRNMELTTFNPYSGKFAGYNISKGKLSTELKYKVENRKLNAEHHIVVDNLEFGDKTDSKDAAPIPVKLAVALLKDRNGVIDIQLPVTGSLDDPKFRLGPIIWKAVLGLLTKIVTAPFAAIGALFGGGDELAYVEFGPGSSELAAAEAEKLDKLTKALIERPQLRLDVPLTLVDEQDAPVLARKALDAQVPPAPSDVADDAAKRQRLAAFEKAYTNLMKTAPVYPPETKTEDGIDVGARLAWIEKAMLEKLQPERAALDELARQRAQAVQAALLKNPELNPERVFITTDRQGKAEGGKVRMEMKLE